MNTYARAPRAEADGRDRRVRGGVLRWLGPAGVRTGIVSAATDYRQRVCVARHPNRRDPRSADQHRGLETSYEFQLTYTRCRECEDIVYEILLPSGRLLGSFQTQSVSLDLNSAGVTLKPGFYEYSLSATGMGDSAKARWQGFEPPEEVPQPLTSTTSPGLATGAEENTAHSTVTPNPIGLANQISPSPKATSLTNAQKLAKALRACRHQPRKRRARCVRLAHRRHGAAGTKSRER
jgi:hypothetical protein